MDIPGLSPGCAASPRPVGSKSRGDVWGSGLGLLREQTVTSEMSLAGTRLGERWGEGRDSGWSGKRALTAWGPGAGDTEAATGTCKWEPPTRRSVLGVPPAGARSGVISWTGIRASEQNTSHSKASPVSWGGEGGREGGRNFQNVANICSILNGGKKKPNQTSI